MTARALACALLAPWCLLAQLRLFVLDGPSERLVVGTLDLGAVETGEALEAAFRIRNAGFDAARVETLTVAGSAFALLGSPQLPATMAPGASLDFRVRFEAAAASSYSAPLRLNSLVVWLRAEALAAAVVSVDDPGGRAVISSAAPVDFGSAERDSSTVRRFWLDNQTASRLTVTVTVTGPAFRGPLGLASPVSLEPRESASFEVLFEPQQAGPLEGALKVNRRTFRLRGAGADPPFPRPQILFDPPTAASAQQVRLALRLSSASRLDSSGEVRLEFQPAVPSGADDPAIVFLSTGKRTAPFTVARGEEAALFDSRPHLEFQTGTTAGRILLTARLGDHLEQAVLTISPMPVLIDSLKATRGESSLEVSLAGFDNTHSASQVAFTFFDPAGRAVAPGRIVIEAATQFRQHFETSGLGGLFSLRAAFPVTGDAAGIAAAEVEITNAAGVTRSGQVSVTR